MTKKQYFYWLWALTFAATVISAIIISMFALPISESDPAAIQASAGIMLLVIIGIVRILFNGFVIAAGLDFAQNIGARLLFLNGQFDFKKDIFKPATLVATTYAGVYLLTNGLLMKYAGTHWLYLFSNSETNWLLLILVVIFGMIQVINEDIWLLLLGVSGIALLVKKIIRNISASQAILISVFLCSLLSGFHVIWKHGITMSAIVPLIEAIGQAMLLGLLFWKKGFETAVFCHLTIAFILYLVVPGVIFALGF